jgi:PKD repeat protein
MKTLVLSVGIFLLAFSKLPAATVYVSPVSSNPTFPYATWATAATGIQEGLDAAPQGGVVLVTNGAYAGGLVISKPLTLLSINGPVFTVIDGGGSNQCVSMTDGAGMSGFTLTHGVAASGGGVRCSSTNAYLTNCVIVSNVATNGNGGGAYNGTLYNCLLSSNSVVSEPGVGGGAYESGLYNCTVVGNTASFAGGVSSFSAIYNCIDCYNSAPVYPNFSDGMRLNYCCAAPMPTNGVGNITNAPAFVDLRGGDFRLQDFSPCINAGNNAFAFGATDLDGNPRLSAGTVDMGAYEYQFSGPPSIFLQPYSQSVYGGSDVDFDVGSVGAVPLSWQWQSNGVPIPFATSSSLTLASVKTNQSAGYSVVITNSLGSITSQVAVLTVRDTAPTFIYQLPSRTVTVGSNVTFTGEALGSLPLSWQWSFNGNPIRDATNSELTLPAVTTGQGGSYFVVVTNSLGSITSQVAVLTVLAAPSITLQPLSQVVVAGGSVTFTASAIGDLPLSWQWEFNGTAIPQATASSLTLASVTTNQAGGYSVVITNAIGSVTSQVAVLTVLSGLSPGTKYVWQNSPTPTAPYTNWATAAHTIQDAVDVGFPGDAILVTNGVYATGSRAGVDGTPARLLVTTVLALRSINGPEFTIVDGGGTNQCVAMTNGVSLSGFTLTNGSASWGGGAMAYFPGTGLLTNCVLTGNQAYSIGGGAQFCTLYDCTLTGNGGSLSNGAAAAVCTLYDCYLTGNSGWGGGAAWACNLYGCALTDNSGDGADSSTLYNCTVAGNQGFGVFESTVYNCIVYYNRSPYGSQNYFFSTFNYCCTTPMPTNGVGNITNEPALVTDWRLSSTSPCLGAGSAAYAQGVDLDGEPWRKPPAIGCDEYYTGSLTGALSVASTASWMTVPTGFTVVFDGAITGRASDSRWEFGDGTVESNRLHTAHYWLTAGNYNVVLRAYNSDYPAGVTAALTVRVVAQVPVYYVDANSPNTVAPYTNWSTAAGNIQDAIAAVSVPQSLVLVTNGTYPGGVTVTNPIKLISVNGPVFTVVDGGGTNLCLSLNTNVSVSGFTVTNGSAGVSCVSSNAYLTNCVLVGNSSGGGTQGGTLYNCVLSNNSGSGASSATLYNCTLSSNAPSLNGSGAFNCTLYNCDLTANGGGAAAWSCLLYNCALTGNSQDGADYSTLYNCTLTANGNLAASGSKLYNCIAYYNPVSGGPNYDNSCTLNYCCTVPMPANGVGNITNEPALAGSWRLSADSPCRGAGSATYASGVDLDGEPWLNPPSIGCDEFYSGSVTGVLSATITASWTNVSTDFTVSFDGQIFGNAGANRWEFGDGTIESNRLHTTHAWLSPGDYTVVLRA